MELLTLALLAGSGPLVSAAETAGLIGVMGVIIAAFTATKVVPRGTVDKMLADKDEAHSRMVKTLEARVEKLERQQEDLLHRERAHQDTQNALIERNTRAIENISGAITANLDVQTKDLNPRSQPGETR